MEFRATNIQRIESVSAIGAVLQEVFLRFRKFLPSLIFVEAVPATTNACRLQCQDKIFIVLPVDERKVLLFLLYAIIFQLKCCFISFFCDFAHFFDIKQPRRFHYMQ